MARDRRKAEDAGRAAEWVALWYLRLKGWRLLAHRYKSPAGEVDLIMRKGGTTAFIEVKSRRNPDDAITAVTDYQAAASQPQRAASWAAIAGLRCSSAVLTSSR